MDIVTRFLERHDVLLARLDEQLQQASSAHDAAWILCEYTGRELNLADCVVYLPANDGALMQVAAWGSLRGAECVPESRKRLPLGAGIVGACARQLSLLRVDDTRNDARYVQDGHPGLSELAAPIVQDDILLGVLDSESREAGFYDARYEAAFACIVECAAAHLWQWLRAHADGKA